MDWYGLAIFAKKSLDIREEGDIAYGARVHASVPGVNDNGLDNLLLRLLHPRCGIGRARGARNTRGVADRRLRFRRRGGTLAQHHRGIPVVTGNRIARHGRQNAGAQCGRQNSMPPSRAGSHGIWRRVSLTR